MTKIVEIYKTKPAPVLSFEVFPPKKEGGIESLYKTLGELDLKHVGVDYISVTYGAGGSDNHEKTREIASYIQKNCDITALHNLTGVNQTPKLLKENLAEIKLAGIENIFALRGDLPSSDYVNEYYPYAKDLIQEIKQDGRFSVGAAIYPEGHVDNPITGISVNGVKEKVIYGTEFLISQLFFDNSVFYNMQEALKENYIKVPVSAGILPIISRAQVERITYMIGSSLPARLTKIVHKYGDHPEALQEAGMEYALQQIYDLLDHGVDGIHLYAMNQPKVLKTMLPKINEYIQSKKLTR
ncbi:methylenetetrahydrofolate reductase [Leuconostoc litchii]|uniref:Methylenetetrahydrofolate reductase n=1 Tax=Leuconostoc litchii TaxID=1981069 RepID=A0A652NE19_9LACO|nr:methylenetetrahydrofolate reductase [Leuconostoc litchii]TYC46520.1 methylenetetrahydrofolate reductase [Leuconostoc litchii]GMA70163.1 methylenetetrahydrofolate reductase [Leuconostoc litchii]